MKLIALAILEVVQRVWRASGGDFTEARRRGIFGGTSEAWRLTCPGQHFAVDRRKIKMGIDA
jgi:hypothetical protein